MAPSSARTKSVVQRPTVSVIVPTSNEEDRIDQCLLAIGAKTYPRIVDVVVADGRSTGRTRERASAHPRVKRLDNAKRLQVAGPHLALTEASGEVIVRVDRQQFLRYGRARATTARRPPLTMAASLCRRVCTVDLGPGGCGATARPTNCSGPPRGPAYKASLLGPRIPHGHPQGASAGRGDGPGDSRSHTVSRLPSWRS
jgi:cellulose synthase/poly-beta-1,6-N-acetylglucosamine synthase-like glycosyltransferase